MASGTFTPVAQLACRSCSRSLLLTAEQSAGACLMCSPVLVAAHRRLEIHAEPVEGPAGDPEHGGSPPPGELPADQRADTVPAPPPDRDTAEMSEP